MQIQTKTQNGITAMLLSDIPAPIADAQGMLDLMMTAQYEGKANRIALPKSALTEDFFRLRTGVAGEILQKVSTYQFKLAIYGDFSGYTSKPLQDFIRECNRGTTVFFCESEAAAAEKLLQA